MLDHKKNIGANNASLTRVFGKVAETIGARISHSLQHPAIEQYAQVGYLHAAADTPERHRARQSVPMMAQLYRDLTIYAEGDGQAVFDALGAWQKQPHGIEESKQRFYAYNHFGQPPEPLGGWFDLPMAGAAQRP